MHYRLKIFIIFLLALTSCAKKSTISDVAIRNANIPIFLEIPHNPLVFDNVSPLITEALHHHYLRIGYCIVNTSHDGYTLRLRVKALDPTSKLVSPDIVLMHTKIRCELECILLDFGHQIVAQKTFSFFTLISKSKNPILNSDFIDFEYRRLFERAAPQIERFFRPYLVEAFTKDEQDKNKVL
ncbi:MAG: hypothetical protein WCW33_01740 [Candidatus Babeliales bacterium]|jgi:hypothetical protein